MKINDLFQREITRPINGVVKADQLDESSVWQELDEFVVTRELDVHLRKFFSTYLDDTPGNDNIGVWVSGFFGSGKSHFIKVLSYLLRNHEHHHQGESRKAVDFFETKIQDAMLYGDIKRAVATDTDVILFNIDSKADSKNGRDAILAVFLKVLNEMQGYCPDHPHIAHMERYLSGKGKLDAFHQAFKAASGSDWIDERDAYEFHHDEVIAAWCAATGQSEEAAQHWIEGAEKNFSLSVENFCKWVKDYLDTQSATHRILFLVDEVGQFIGGDTHLMLNLQTIAEDLGTLCEGRAWIVVTSQEDIDAVLGEMKTKSHDFSKIQGRFPTRLSLSSANVDEVIHERLLAKDEKAIAPLQKVFQEKGDILKHQLSFNNVGMTLPPYKDSDDFIKNYPFAPYQFKLVQKVFEAIRKAGATGLHLSRGERSILDAFQSAAKDVANEEIGVLVPLYRFYPSIESFLDTAVKRTIDQAGSNPGLQHPVDLHMLQTLFLIRYVDEIKGNIDNLVTLCIDEIDADRLALRRQIEESLLRLEKETLINRSGENFYFLTNEERDISREIKNVDLAGHEEAKLMGDIVFEGVLKGLRKHRYMANKMDFAFNRLCDLHPVGNRLDGGLVVSVITPLADDYTGYRNDKCILESTKDDGQVLIRLDDNRLLGREIRAYLQVDKYLRTKDDGTLASTTKRIHRDLADENRKRHTHLSNLLKDLIGESELYVAGQRVDCKSTDPFVILSEALDYLIRNTFSKMGYLKHLNEHPEREMQAILRSNDLQQQSLAIQVEDGNALAVEEVRKYINLSAQANHAIVLYDLIERYGKRPYGWPEGQVLLIIARLIVLQEIQLIMNGAPLTVDKVFEAISSSGKQRKISVIRRRTSDPQAIQKARNLAKDVFSEMGPNGEDALFSFLQSKLTGWQQRLHQFKPLADSGRYPGKSEIQDGLTLISAILACDESVKCIERFNERKADLLDLSENFHDLDHFYSHQRSMWDKLIDAQDKLALNKYELSQNDQARKGLEQMQLIREAPSPYGLIKEVETLIQTTNSINQQLLKAERDKVEAHIDSLCLQLDKEAKAAGIEGEVLQQGLKSLQDLQRVLSTQESIAHIGQVDRQSLSLYDRALERLEKAQITPPAPTPTSGTEPVAPTPTPAKPKLKPRHIIKTATLCSSTYLESPDDMEAFLKTLREEMTQALQDGKRIEIR